MSQRPFRPFDDKAELERELMDVDYRFLEGDEVGHRRSDDDEEGQVPRDHRKTPVDAMAPATA